MSSPLGDIGIMRPHQIYESESLPCHVRSVLEVDADWWKDLLRASMRGADNCTTSVSTKN